MPWKTHILIYPIPSSLFIKNHKERSLSQETESRLTGRCCSKVSIVLCAFSSEELGIGSKSSKRLL